METRPSERRAGALDDQNQTHNHGPRIGRGPILPVPTRWAEIDAGAMPGVIFRPLPVHRDGRGWLVELFRNDELPADLWPRMAYTSMTQPGVSRGPHEHVDQTDGFAFLGPSDFRVWLWDTRAGSPTRGARATFVAGNSCPTALWVPPGVVHAYRNVGDGPGLVFNAPNRLYAGWNKSEPVDEIRHEDADPGRFAMDD